MCDLEFEMVYQSVEVKAEWGELVILWLAPARFTLLAYPRNPGDSDADRAMCARRRQTPELTARVVLDDSGTLDVGPVWSRNVTNLSAGTVEESAWKRRLAVRLQAWLASHEPDMRLARAIAHHNQLVELLRYPLAIPEGDHGAFESKVLESLREALPATRALMVHERAAVRTWVFHHYIALMDRDVATIEIADLGFVE